MSKLKETLARLTVDEMKSLMRCLPDAAPIGKKNDGERKVLGVPKSIRIRWTKVA